MSVHFYVEQHAIALGEMPSVKTVANLVRTVRSPFDHDKIDMIMYIRLRRSSIEISIL